ncbi:rubredoxin [Variovorax defluvii]|uniref:rubredoxin n=1 Tax=Variovorax defluvii TaxID=913761 RepID=UPI0031E940D3
MTDSTSAASTSTAVLAASPADFKVWACVLCGFLYSEAEGLPDMGIAPGTRWADVPDSFVCPDCSATKVDFEMIEI